MTEHTPRRPRHAFPVTSAGVQVRPWVRPAVSKMRAGDAEIGPNPDNADGAFTFS
ncbi:MAG: hypothetical protein JWM65_1627 [Sphingomonas bacterium]|nr:hypothetical protein [Sphingomonas bacterium]